MLLEEQERTLVQSDAFPDSITGNETGIEQRYLGLGARHQPAVEVDQGLRVSRIGSEVLAASHYGIIAGVSRSA